MVDWNTFWAWMIGAATTAALIAAAVVYCIWKIDRWLKETPEDAAIKRAKEKYRGSNNFGSGRPRDGRRWSIGAIRSR